MKTVPSGKNGFSLIEVALALVVIAIAVASLISMFGFALDSERLAGRDTVLVSLSSQVLNRLRTVPFDALWLADPSATPNPPAPSTPPAETTYYFSDDGALLVTSTSGVPPPEALFRCVVQKRPDESSRTVPGLGPYNRLTLDLQFSWPVSTTDAAARPNLQILHASIARY